MICVCCQLEKNDQMIKFWKQMLSNFQYCVLKIKKIVCIFDLFSLVGRVDPKKLRVYSIPSFWQTSSEGGCASRIRNEKHLSS